MTNEWITLNHQVEKQDTNGSKGWMRSVERQAARVRDPSGRRTGVQVSTLTPDIGGHSLRY
jgi:hypothetical protein